MDEGGALDAMADAKLRIYFAELIYVVFFYNAESEAGDGRFTCWPTNNEPGGALE